MTNNIDRAAELLYNEGCGSGDTAHYIARRLADAGLLMPNLPEPHTFPDGDKEWYPLDGWVNLDTDGKIITVYDERDEDDIAAGAEIEPGELVFTRISEANDLALALLAATIYAQKEETNE